MTQTGPNEYILYIAKFVIKIHIFPFRTFCILSFKKKHLIFNVPVYGHVRNFYVYAFTVLRLPLSIEICFIPGWTIGSSWLHTRSCSSVS